MKSFPVLQENTASAQTFTGLAVESMPSVKKKTRLISIQQDFSCEIK